MLEEINRIHQKNYLLFRPTENAIIYLSTEKDICDIKQYKQRIYEDVFTAKGIVNIIKKYF